MIVYYIWVRCVRDKGIYSKTNFKNKIKFSHPSLIRGITFTLQSDPMSFILNRFV